MFYFLRINLVKIMFSVVSMVGAQVVSISLTIHISIS